MFDEIDVDAGRGYKDFGKGFYATAIPAHADRIAIRNKHIAEKRREYQIRTQGIKMNPIIAYRYNLIFNEQFEGLSVKTFLSADSEWLRFIIANRNCKTCAHEYDIVIGFTADAETTAILNDYYDELVENDFSEEICKRVISELKPENLPKQYFFRTEKAIETLSFGKIKRQVVG